MVRWWIPVLVVILLVGAVVGVGVYFISEELGCTAEETVEPSEYAGKKLRVLQPLIAYSFQSSPEVIHLTDMQTKNTDGGHASYTLLPIPSEFQVVDHIVKTTEACERTTLARLRDAKGKSYLLHIEKLQAYMNGERPYLSRFYTSSIEPNFEPGSQATYPYMIRFAAPGNETEMGMDANTFLLSRLGEVKLNFDALGFPFEVAQSKPEAHVVVMNLTQNAATYLSQSDGFFRIAKFSALAK